MQSGSTPATPGSPTAEDWDRQFATGGWEYLKGLDELAHHSVVAGYIAHGAGPRPSVLDVGCGEAVLQALLRDYGFYLGLDWSAVAIERAAARQDARTRFAVADAEHYTPPRLFDAIVFSECLYYFGSAVDTLQRYAAALTAGGVFAVSMYRTADTARTWHAIEAALDVLDRVSVTNARGTAWDVAMLRPRA